MSPKLAGLIGRTILVSIPVLFEDGKARPYRLAGVELYGLWLESSELADRLLQTETRKSSSVIAALVPFAQIGSVLVARASQTGTGTVSVPTSQASSSLGERQGQPNKNRDPHVLRKTTNRPRKSELSDPYLNSDAQAEVSCASVDGD